MWRNREKEPFPLPLSSTARACPYSLEPTQKLLTRHRRHTRLSLIFIKTKKAVPKVKRLHSLVSRGGSFVWKAKKSSFYSSWSHFKTCDRMKPASPRGLRSCETCPRVLSADEETVAKWKICRSLSVQFVSFIPKICTGFPCFRILYIIHTVYINTLYICIYINHNLFRNS